MEITRSFQEGEGAYTLSTRVMYEFGYSAAMNAQLRFGQLFTFGFCLDKLRGLVCKCLDKLRGLVCKFVFQSLGTKVT